MREIGRHWRLSLALLLLLTGAIYAPSLGNGFAMDDRLVAMDINDAGQPLARIHELQPLSVYFSTHYWADTAESGRLYRPVTVLSYALLRAVLGPAAWHQHLLNILLQLLATFLVFRLLRPLARSQAALFAGVAVFSLHAIHSEVVSGIVGRAELFAFVFGLWALLFLVRGGSGELPAWRKAVRVLLASFCLFLALCSKEVALAWIPLVVVYELVLGLRDKPQRSILESLMKRGLRILAVAIVPVAVWLFLRHAALSPLPPAPPTAWMVNPLADMEAIPRIVNATVVMGYALILSLFPFHLAADCGALTFPLFDGFSWTFVLALLALIAFAIFGILRSRRRPLLLLAVAGFFGFALVISNHFFAIGTIFGERLYYASSLGIACFATWLFHACERRGWKIPIIVCFSLWCGASSLVIWQRNSVWKDDTTLFLSEVQTQPRSVRMHVCAASVHGARGEQASALRHLRRAVELDPELAIAWNNLAAISLELGRLEEAERYAKRGLAARHIMPLEDPYKLHCNLALIHVAQKRIPDAIRDFARAWQERPAFYRIFTELYDLRRKGVITPDSVLEILESCARAKPGYPQWDAYRSILDHFEGRFERAATRGQLALSALSKAYYSEALREQLRFSLGHSLLQIGKREEGASILQSLAEDRFVAEGTRSAAREQLKAKKQ